MSGTPQRTCLGCRKADDKDKLIRLAWDAQTGRVVEDVARRAPGRGAYVHRGCVARAARGVGRTLKRPVDGAQVAALLAGLGDGCETARPLGGSNIDE